MHTKLRLMALGVILLGGSASVAQAEAGPECDDLFIPGWGECPAYSTWYDVCESMRPSCGTPSVAYCNEVGPNADFWCSWNWS